MVLEQLDIQMQKNALGSIFITIYKKIVNEHHRPKTIKFPEEKNRQYLLLWVRQRFFRYDA